MAKKSTAYIALEKEVQELKQQLADTVVQYSNQIEGLVDKHRGELTVLSDTCREEDDKKNKEYAELLGAWKQWGQVATSDVMTHSGSVKLPVMLSDELSRLLNWTTMKL